MRRSFVSWCAVFIVVFLQASIACGQLAPSAEVKSDASTIGTIHASDATDHKTVKGAVPMRFLWFIALLLPLSLETKKPFVGARRATISINSREVTVLHLRPESESTIHMPEEVTSVILGSPGQFEVEHKKGEPKYVYVKPISKEAAQSNLLIETKSGQHVAMELVSDGDGTTDETQPVDFLIEYKAARMAPIIEIHPVSARVKSKPVLPSRYVMRFIVSTVSSTAGLIGFVLTGPIIFRNAMIHPALDAFYLTLVVGWCWSLFRMWRLTFESRNAISHWIHNAADSKAA